MKTLGYFVTTGSLVALLGGCTATSQWPLAPENPPPPTIPEALAPYYLQVGDVLDVKLLLNPELNEEVTVRPDGHISTTVDPDAVAAGQTVAQLATTLRHAYSNTLHNPQLSVVVKSFAPTRVYVGGEVNSPGEFVTVGPALTLSQAITRAGGVRFSSDETNVFIIRRSGGQPQFLSTHFRDVMHAIDPRADVRLAEGDVVYVPRTGIAEVYRWWNQYVEQFAHPSFGFSYIVGNSSNAVITGPAGNTATVTPAR